MATPSIQTLMTDAQQVLNLKTVSEIHATLTAALANANVGTPLNPNLTTQQLWDEFYEIVRQTPTDIESILVNQMMKFLYSPPAPGGAGANTQVIFNDGGVLAGDAGLTYNKTTDALTVGGNVQAASATITGDLTVDTNVLKVDTLNNRVGIGTASPTAALQVNLAEISSAAGTSAIITNTTGAGNRIAALRLTNLSNQWNIRAYGAITDDLRFGNGATGSEVDYLSIGNTGIFTWSNVGGVAGTAMTLNSTGLGVGASPTANCKLSVNGGVFLDRGATGGASQLLAVLAASSGGNFGQISNTGTRWALGYGSTLTTVGTEALIWDTSGNVGIGITSPSYLLHTSVPTGGDRNMVRFQVSGASSGLTITWNNGTQKMRVNFGDLPTSSAGLPANTLWVDTAAGNTLKLA